MRIENWSDPPPDRLIYLRSHDSLLPSACTFFFFNDTATTEIYTLSLHDALPISAHAQQRERGEPADSCVGVESCGGEHAELDGDRKSTRLNSSHVEISYAVF